MHRTLEEILDLLRREGSDTTDIEVKAAAGFPESLTASLSALANLPGGGVGVLGLDQNNGFRPVPIDVSALKQALGSKARTFQPPLTIEIEDGAVDGVPIVVCRVRECNAAHKPCRASDGRAYLRSWDGDHLVMNPGGLHGISVDRLGYERTTTSRNARLVAIAQHVSSPDTGGRVIEALSTGLAVVRDELHRADLPAPVFVDNAIRFTAIVKRSEFAPSPRSAGRNRVEQDIYAALVAGPRTARSLAAIVGTGEPNVRKALRSLGKQSLVVTHGGKGRSTTYERATPPD